MSKKIVALSLFLLGVSKSMLLAQVKSESLDTPARSATVYLYQGKVFGLFSLKYKVYANGRLLCKLGRNSNCRIPLPAGSTTFTTKPPIFGIGSQPSLTLNLEERKAYYIQADAKLILFPPSSPLVLTEVVPNSDKLDQINRSKVEKPLLTSIR